MLCMGCEELIKIRRARVSDLPQLIVLHKTSGVAGILTFFTQEQLLDLVYRPIIADDSFQTRVAVISPDSVVGVICISDLKAKAFQTFSLRRFDLVVRLTTQIVCHPKLLRLIYNYARMQQYIKSSILATNSDYKEIQFLLVNSDNHSRGIGTELMSLAIDTETSYIVQTQNLRALDFYGRGGFKIVKHFGFGSHKLWLMLRAANNES